MPADTPRPLSPEQRRRYSRNIMLPEIGREGQQRLLASSALIIGAGALGSIAAMYLAGSGVGRLTIADFDTIDISNLQRQLSFSTSQCGTLKAEALAERIRAINPDISVTILPRLITAREIDDLVSTHDIVLEGSDNPSTKYLVSDACTRLSIPYVLGGVSAWQGQVMSWSPGYPGYRDLFPDAADEGGYTPCSLGGVLGPLPGIIGSYQAAEALKILTGTGTPLHGRLLLLDLLHSTATTLTL